jgi:hypothetical protein
MEKRLVVKTHENSAEYPATAKNGHQPSGSLPKLKYAQ